MKYAMNCESALLSSPSLLEKNRCNTGAPSTTTGSENSIIISAMSPVYIIDDDGDDGDDGDDDLKYMDCTTPLD